MRSYLLWFVLGLVVTGILAIAFDHLPHRVVYAIAVALTGSTAVQLMIRAERIIR